MLSVSLPGDLIIAVPFIRFFVALMSFDILVSFIFAFAMSLFCYFDVFSDVLVSFNFFSYVDVFLIFLVLRLLFDKFIC